MESLTARHENRMTGAIAVDPGADRLPCLVWTIGTTNTVTFINDHWRAYTGLATSALLDGGWLSTIHPDDLEALNRFLQSPPSQSDQGEVEARVRGSDGLYRWHLIHGGGPPFETGRTLVAVDVERVKRAQELALFLVKACTVLAQSLEQDEILGSIGGVVVPMMADWCSVNLLGPEGQIRRAGASHRDPRLETTVVQLGPVYAHALSARESTQQRLRRGEAVVLSNVTPEFLAQLQIEDGDRQRLVTLDIASAIVVPLMVGDGLIGTLNVVRDHRNQPFADAELDALRMVGGRMALQLESARLYGAARRAITEREAFLSVASHELKNPLGGLIGHAQVLHRRAIRSGYSDSDQELILRMIDQGRRLNQLLDKLMDIARLDTGQFAIEQEALDLGALVEGVVAEVQTTTSAHVITVNHASQPMHVLGDRVRLEQVFLNLLSNAIKYSPNGGAIHVDVSTDGSYACVSVRDEGRGIAMADLPHIFERFRRGPGSGKGYAKGLGVGLYVVREIVARHGGTVTATSIEGHGATFEVRLPLD